MRISSSFKMIAATASYYLARARSRALTPVQDLLRGKPAPTIHLRNGLGPWEMLYIGLLAEFSEETDWELSIYYLIPINRRYETSILARDCKSPISGVDVTLSDSREFNTDADDMLVLYYDLDKSAIAGSNIWDGPSSELAVCHAVRLVSDNLTMAEDRRVFEISFDLSVDFAAEEPVEQAVINVEADDVGVASYVESCKCGGMQNFTCDASALSPNDELFLCIKSASSDVEVDRLGNMWASQRGILFPIIENGNISHANFTSMEYKPNENGVVVSTVLPVSLFNFSAGESVSVAGDVDMKLVGDGRRLRASVNSPYGLEVALRRERRDAVDERSSSPSSADAMAFNCLIALGSVLGLFAK